MNIWYLIALKGEKFPFGYHILTPKEKYYKDLEEAKRMKTEHELVEVMPVVILKRTCEELANV